MQFAQEIFVELVVLLTICLDAFCDLIGITMFDVSGWNEPRQEMCADAEPFNTSKMQ